jgi:subtilisin family serine protease
MRRALSLSLLFLLVLAAPAAAARGPIVAVLDSGVDVKHPVFKGSLWRNTAEIAKNGTDDDGNGIVDDVNGVDLVGNDGSPKDPRGHGTHVAGIIARGGGVRIMAIRIIGRDGTGNSTDLATGIDYAVAHGARVLNLSVSDYGDDPAVSAALARASAAGAVVVAAAGNAGKDLDVESVYPASYRTPGMLVVAAGDETGRLTDWSGHGAGTVDLVAPGVEIRSALPGKRYGRKTGTSQATAAVTRTVARVLAAAPAASVAQVRTALLGAVDRTAALTGAVASGGTLDLRGALAALGG